MTHGKKQYDLLDPYLTLWEKRQSDDRECQLVFPHQLTTSSLSVCTHYAVPRLDLQTRS